jgi:hypothetical protein
MVTNTPVAAAAKQMASQAMSVMICLGRENGDEARVGIDGCYMRGAR